MKPDRPTNAQAFEARSHMYALRRRAVSDPEFSKEIMPDKQERRSWHKLIIDSDPKAKLYSDILERRKRWGTQEDFAALPKAAQLVTIWAEKADDVVEKRTTNQTIPGIINADIGVAFRNVSAVTDLCNELAVLQDGEVKTKLQEAFNRELGKLMLKSAENGTVQAGMLAEVIRWYTHNPLAEKTATTMLQSYFKGPEKFVGEERMDAYAKSFNTLAEAAALLASDSEALTKAAEIGMFHNDAIVSSNSTYFNQVMRQNYSLDMYTFKVNEQVAKAESDIAREASGGTGFAVYTFSLNDGTQKSTKEAAVNFTIPQASKALERFRLTKQADIIFENLADLFNLDSEKRQEILEKRMDIASQTTLDFAIKTRNELRKPLTARGVPTTVSHEMFIGLVNNVTDAISLTGAIASSVLGERSKHPIFRAVYLDWSNATKIYQRDIFPLVNIRKWEMQVRENVPGELKRVVFRRPDTADESTLYFLIPADRQLTPEIIEETAKNYQALQDEETGTNQDAGREERIFKKVGLLRGNVGDFDSVEGFHVYYLIRDTTLEDRKIHPSVTLEAFGFPQIHTQEGENLENVNRELIKSIEENRLRFLSNRGYRIPLRGIFDSLGYASMTLKTDKKYPLGGSATFRLKTGEDIAVRLDDNLQLAFDGQSPPTLEFQNILRYNILWYLENILCAPVKQAGESDSPDTNKNIVQKNLPGRGATLPDLPIDWRSGKQQQPSRDAKALCLKEKGIDLEVYNAQRQAQGLRIKTYRQATEVDLHTVPVELPLAIPPLFN